MIVAKDNHTQIEFRFEKITIPQNTPRVDEHQHDARKRGTQFVARNALISSTSVAGSQWIDYRCCQGLNIEARLACACRPLDG
ncbi:MAG: hypothetical protein ACREEE_17730 [Dongiaceae bacterium]